MPVLLTEFLKNNVGLFYDAEADKQLDEEEFAAAVRKLIFDADPGVQLPF